MYKLYINKFPFSEIAVNETCKGNDSNQCAHQQAECRNDHGYRCLCKDKHYQKGNICAPRMYFILIYNVLVPVKVPFFSHYTIKKFLILIDMIVNVHITDR